MESLYFGSSYNITDVDVKIAAKTLSCLAEELLQWVL